MNNNKAIKAATWYTISNFISKGIFYLCTPIYTRLLTTYEYGQYSNFLSWQTILVSLLTFDLYSAINTAFLDYSDENKFEGFISTISVFSLVIPFMLGMIILVFKNIFMNVFNVSFLHLIIMLSYVCFGNTLTICQTEQIVNQKYIFSSILTIFSTCGSVIITLILTFCMKDKLTGILLGSVVVTETTSLFLLFFVLRRKLILKKQYLQYAFAISIPLLPHVLATTILGSSDKVMITKLCGNMETAMYSLVYTISMVVTMFTASINKAWVPWFFDKLKHYDYAAIKNAVKLILPVGAITSFGVCLFAPEIVAILGGEKYESAVILMPPLILHSVCNYYCTLYINIEFYNKKTFGISIATTISLAINILMNFYFIRLFGYQAAAYTTFFSSVVNLIFHLYKIRKQKMLKVFNNRFNILLLIITVFAVMLLVPVYKNNVLRLAVIFGYVIMISLILIKYRNYIRKILKVYLPNKSGIKNENLG
ncbi:hypothetical protein D3Z51_19000 [Clostridiaceae bacterium]|nr:hypothetical protein [Clostridiaceae bacterium]RKI08580.1 hypothetical protein D7V81_18845 [bacterium 1XD21-70]